jgi:hypothetical protein
MVSFVLKPYSLGRSLAEVDMGGGSWTATPFFLLAVLAIDLREPVLSNTETAAEQGASRLQHLAQPFKLMFALKGARGNRFLCIYGGAEAIYSRPIQRNSWRNAFHRLIAMR